MYGTGPVCRAATRSRPEPDEDRPRHRLLPAPARRDRDARARSRRPGSRPPATTVEIVTSTPAARDAGGTDARGPGPAAALAWCTALASDAGAGAGAARRVPGSGTRLPAARAVAAARGQVRRRARARRDLARRSPGPRRRGRPGRHPGRGHLHSLLPRTSRRSGRRRGVGWSALAGAVDRGERGGRRPAAPAGRPDREVHVLPNGIDAGRVAGRPAPRPPDEVAGRRRDAAGAAQAAAAAAADAAPGPATGCRPSIDLRAVIVGEGRQRPAMERYLRRHRMAGWVELPGRLPRHAGSGRCSSGPTSSSRRRRWSRSASRPWRPAAPACRWWPGRGRGVGEFVADGQDGLLAGSDADMVGALVRLAADPAGAGADRRAQPDESPSTWAGRRAAAAPRPRTPPPTRSSGPVAARPPCSVRAGYAPAGRAAGPGAPAGPARRADRHRRPGQGVRPGPLAGGRPGPAGPAQRARRAGDRALAAPRPWSWPATGG